MDIQTVKVLKKYIFVNIENTEYYFYIIKLGTFLSKSCILIVGSQGHNTTVHSDHYGKIFHTEQILLG